MLSAPVQGVHRQKKAVVFGGALILIMHVSELHIDSDHLEHYNSHQWQHWSLLSFISSCLREAKEATWVDYAYCTCIMQS